MYDINRCLKIKLIREANFSPPLYRSYISKKWINAKRNKNPQQRQR